MRPLVTAEEILNAANRIRPFIHRTPVLTSCSINQMMEKQLFFKCENFQKVGAFKARGATNTLFSIPENELINGVATHSSGNHAQALSWAAALKNIPAYIVMPSNSSQVKVDAVRSYGGIITFCEPTLIAREKTLTKVMQQTGAIEIHPYNDTRIIAGQATAALELMQEVEDLDLVLAPVGGGGLLSGTALSAHHFYPETDVIGVEPEQANDAFLSFTHKKFIPSVNPDTIADGLRTSLGTITFPIILDHVKNIITVREDSLIEAMRIMWERMKIIVEPSSAVPLAAVLEKKILPGYEKIGIILSGGNVDLENLPWIKE
jgi:threonine dehydratase